MTKQQQCGSEDSSKGTTFSDITKHKLVTANALDLNITRSCITDESELTSASNILRHMLRNCE